MLFAQSNAAKRVPFGFFSLSRDGHGLHLMQFQEVCVSARKVLSTGTSGSACDCQWGGQSPVEQFME